MNLAALLSMRDAASHVASGATGAAATGGGHCEVGLWERAGRLMAALIVWTPLPRSFRCCWATPACPMRLPATATISAFLAAVHPRHGIPHRSLVALGLVAAGFCFFSLAQGLRCW